VDDPEPFLEKASFPGSFLPFLWFKIAASRYRGKGGKVPLLKTAVSKGLPPYA